MNTHIMKKFFLYWILIMSQFFYANLSFAIDTNIEITGEDTGRNTNNDKLQELNSDDFFYVWTQWEKWLKNLFLNIARDLRVIIFAMVLIIWIIMVFKLMFWDNTEEESQKLKNGILWASVWIIVMQTAFSAYKILFNQDINWELGKDFTKDLIEPFTDMLMLLASFAFISMWVYAFYKIVTANGDDGEISQWKMTLFNAVIGFIVIKFAETIVKNTFNPNCWWWWIFQYYWTNICENITENAKIITTIINWFNTFVAIIIIIMVMYAWFLVLSSGWDSENTDKAKKIFFYIGIGLLILFMSYLILTFFLRPDTPIVWN